MDLRLSVEPPDHLVVHLKEGAEDSTVTVSNARLGAASLIRALDAAAAEGYGECMWPGAEGGQYWWMFRREAESLEVIAMWSRGGASGWQHVFRAADALDWVQERVAAEVARLGLSA